MKVSASIFFFLFLSISAFNQSSPQKVVLDTILLNNGNVVATHVVDTLGGTITIEKPNSRKHKKTEIDKEEVFSIRFGSTGKEEIFYIYDTLTGNDFSIEDARKFIAGEQDAQRGFHAVGVSVAAFAIGFASGAYEGNFFAAGPPFFFDGIMTYPAIHVRRKKVRDVKIANTDPYLYGYYMTASRKRMLHSFLWSGIGLAAGLIVNFTVINK
ncbi:MAG TPA: hypothetical protein VN922_09650 [Bacteroidia bacterium]|nr:hypothetical protein [Bacteroidia bacterium]